VTTRATISLRTATLKAVLISYLEAANLFIWYVQPPSLFSETDKMCTCNPLHFNFFSLSFPCFLFQYFFFFFKEKLHLLPFFYWLIIFAHTQIGCKIHPSCMGLTHNMSVYIFLFIFSYFF
jgi:hypothetical protein